MITTATSFGDFIEKARSFIIQNKRRLITARKGKWYSAKKIGSKNPIPK